MRQALIARPEWPGLQANRIFGTHTRRPSSHPHQHATPVGPAALRTRGRRLTRQRQLIWDALVAEPDRHLSAEELVAHVQQRLPRVNPSTVYRTLDLLVEEGLVRRTELGADRAYYEPAREHPHHHVICERCGTVVHIHDEDLGPLKQRIRNATSYELGNAEISLFGLCPTCLKANSATPLTE